MTVFCVLPKQNGKQLLAASYRAQETQSVRRNGLYCLSGLPLGAMCGLVRISVLEVRMEPVPVCGENTRVVLESVSK